MTKVMKAEHIKVNGQRRDERSGDCLKCGQPWRLPTFWRAQEAVATLKWLAEVDSDASHRAAHIVEREAVRLQWQLTRQAYRLQRQMNETGEVLAQLDKALAGSKFSIVTLRPA